jgi:hypothetical protein
MQDAGRPVGESRDKEVVEVCLHLAHDLDRHVHRPLQLQLQLQLEAAVAVALGLQRHKHEVGAQAIIDTRVTGIASSRISDRQAPL